MKSHFLQPNPQHHPPLPTTMVHKNDNYNIYMNENNINEQYVFFSHPVKNKIIHGTFSHVMYSNELFITKFINYLFRMNVNINRFYNAFVCNFNPNQNSLLKIKYLEHCILSNYKYTMIIPDNKLPQYKITTILNSGNIKLFTPHNDKITKTGDVDFCLKIIGIWESHTEYGIIYKIVLH